MLPTANAAPALLTTFLVLNPVLTLPDTLLFLTTAALGKLLNATTGRLVGRIIIAIFNIPAVRVPFAVLILENLQRQAQARLLLTGVLKSPTVLPKNSRLAPSLFPIPAPVPLPIDYPKPPFKVVAIFLLAVKLQATLLPLPLLCYRPIYKEVTFVGTVNLIAGSPLNPLIPTAKDLLPAKLLGDSAGPLNGPYTKLGTFLPSAIPATLLLRTTLRLTLLKVLLLAPKTR